MITARAPLLVREATPAEHAGWNDLVRTWPAHRVTHLRPWVESLAATGCGTPLYLVFERDGETVGALPGLMGSVGPWRLFGSPRVGWQTVSMGPVFDAARTTTSELVSALVPYLEGEHQVAHIELMHTGMDGDAMQQLGFVGQPVFTYRAPLFPGDEPRMRKALKDSARRNVSRAERLGLEVRPADDDERFVDEHYEQLREVYLRNGQAIPFSHRRILECYRHLRPTGNLIALSVYLPGSRICIATGMFFVEGRELSLWMWAHRSHYRWYRPTELMTWTAICQAMAQGCDTFDLMGGGPFKTKFGAEPDRTKWRWMRSRPRWLGAARGLAGTVFHLHQSAWGGLRRAGRETHAALATIVRREQVPPACVVGDVDLVRALGLAGIPSDVVAPPGDAARYSRHARQVLPWVSPSDRPEQLVDVLVTHGQAQPEPPVLFYDTDAALQLISRHRDRLAQAFRFVIPDAPLVDNLVDKGRFQKLAERLRLPVPPAHVVRPGAAPDEALSLAFPVVVKPLQRDPARWRPVAGGHKAIAIATPEDLRAWWPSLTATGLPLLIQSQIAGSEQRLESYHAYVDPRGEVVAEFTGRKIRTSPETCGVSTALETSAESDVARIGRDVLRRLKLRGVAKLDFKRDAGGALHLLEINPRFTLWHHVAARAGVNIPALVHGDLLGRPRPAPVTARAGVRWCRAWADAGAARDQGMSLGRWFIWMIACEAKRAMAWDDPLPLVRAAVPRLLGTGTVAGRRTAGVTTPRLEDLEAL